MNLTEEKVNELVNLVRKRFPGWQGFSDERFLKDETNYKRAAAAKATELLGETVLRELAADGGFDEFIARLEKVGRSTNLLYQAVPTSGDLSILYQKSLDKSAFCVAILDLLYGEGPTHFRLDRFAAYCKDQNLPNKWTFPTYFLFLLFPDKELFIKPSPVRWFMDFAGAEITFASAPASPFYAWVKSVAGQLLISLAEHGAKDMIDIQSFIWVCAGEAKRSGKALLNASKRAEFSALYAEFSRSFLPTEEGKQHAAMYSQGREQARANFTAVTAAADQGQDVTEQVLLKFLPYVDSPPNRQKDAWVHVAPAINADVKSWFENRGWVKPEDWPAIALAVLTFVRRCVAEPAELGAACDELIGTRQVKGLQTGMLTPILNALRPDDFAIVNGKSLRVLNHFASASFKQTLADYPRANAAMRQLVAEMRNTIGTASSVGVAELDLFDMFSHWLVALKAYPFEAKRNSREGGDGRDDVAKDFPAAPPYFTRRTFELLAGLHDSPTKVYYDKHRADLATYVEQPLRRLFTDVAAEMTEPVLSLMETDKGIIAKIPKNDHGQGGAWDFYWGAFYPKGTKRVEGTQLYVWVSRDVVDIGFIVRDENGEHHDRFLRNCRSNLAALTDILRPQAASGFTYGYHDDDELGDSLATGRRTGPSLEEWLRDPGAAGVQANTVLPMDGVLGMSASELKTRVVKAFRDLFPFVLLAVSDDPVPVIRGYLEPGQGTEEPLQPVYSLADCARDTSMPEDELKRWVRAIERKKQAIIYGPPGTGKTFVAEKLARHLVGGGAGFAELIQFHPAYAYEDFIQGIRPETRADGGLKYPLVPGRFLEFCNRAQPAKGRCVLIIDEINRANLARVFGELMYLLEYRDKEIPLAGGRSLRIPDNVRLIGTMNTADRSIALVDYALRRRFAFLPLYPQYEVLERFHSGTGFPVQRLTVVLKELNERIGDRHYSVGITHFLRTDIAEQIEDIWRMEIEPYIEEYFFDQQDKADAFRWERIGERILKG